MQTAFKTCLPALMEPPFHYTTPPPANYWHLSHLGQMTKDLLGQLTKAFWRQHLLTELVALSLSEAQKDRYLS